MDEQSDTAVAWLLESDEPAIRGMTRRDILGGPEPGDKTLEGAIVQALLQGQGADGGFGGHPYKKWVGAHWRLVSLVEMEVPAGESRALRAADTVLGWLTGSRHRFSIPVIDGLARRCASQEGNALAVCSRLGMSRDPRVGLPASRRWRGNGPTAAGTATPERADVGRRFTNRFRPAGGCSSTGGPPKTPRLGGLRSVRPSSSSTTGSSGRWKPVRRFTGRGWRCTIPPTGTTTSSRPCWSCGEWGRPAIPAAPMPSTCWNGAGCTTGPGSPGVTGGVLPVPPGPPKWSTGGVRHPIR